VKGGQGRGVKSIEVVVGVGEGVGVVLHHHPPFCRIRRPTSVLCATTHSHILRGYT
jgi:hypothetical protein